MSDPDYGEFSEQEFKERLTAELDLRRILRVPVWRLDINPKPVFPPKQETAGDSPGGPV